MKKIKLFLSVFIVGIILLGTAASTTVYGWDSREVIPGRTTWLNYGTATAGRSGNSHHTRAQSVNRNARVAARVGRADGVGGIKSASSNATSSVAIISMNFPGNCIHGASSGLVQ